MSTCADVRTLLGPAFAGVFDSMEVAEEEIAAAKQRHPARAGELHGAFGVLCPSPILRLAPQTLYRIHAREILERVAVGESLKPGTDGELLASLLATSLDAPLNQDGAALHERLFRRHFPEQAEELGEEEWATRETWPGALQELEDEARRKLTADR